MKQKFTFLLALLCTVWIGARADTKQVSTADELNSAISAAATGDVIQLNGDITLADDEHIVVSKEGVSFTLDLNGHFIKGAYGTGRLAEDATLGFGTSGIITMGHGTLTVKDSSSGQTGLIENTYTKEGVTYDGSQQYSYAEPCAIGMFKESKFILESGTVKAVGTVSESSAAEAIAVLSSTSGVNVTIKGGNVIGAYAGIINNGKDNEEDLTVTGGTISGYHGIWICTGTNTITGGTITGTVGNAIKACYNTESTIVNISGGTLKGGSLGGIFIYKGTFNISGTANISATGDYGVKNSGGTLNITGGTITGATSYAVWNRTAATTISGGYFSAPSDNPAIYEETTNYPNAKSVISAGYFSSANVTNLESDIVEGKSIVDNPDAATNTNYPKMVGVAQDYVAQIGDTKYTSLADAVAAASSTDATTITMIADATIDAQITVAKDITIDFNNKTITSKCNPFLVENGKLTLDGTGTLNECTVGYPNGDYIGITIKGSTESTAENYSVLNIKSGVKVVSKGYVAGVSNNNNCGYGVVVNADGATLESAYGFTVNGNINKTEGNVPQFTFNGVTMTGCIYGAGYGIWNLTNCTMTADDDDVLSLKAGIFTINGGTYTSGGAYYNPSTDTSNGSANTGAALSLTSNDGYAHKIDVTVNGGTFISKNGNAIYEGIPYKSGTSTYVASQSYATLKVNGGQFLSASDKDAVALTAMTDKKVIYGGYYSVAADVRTAFQTSYVADGYAAVANDGNNSSAIVETYPTMIGAVQETQKTDTYTIDETAASSITTSSSNDLQAAKTAVETNTLDNSNVNNYATNVANSVTEGAIPSAASKNYVSVKLQSAVTSKTEFVPTGESSVSTVVKKMTFDVKPVYVIVTTTTDATTGKTTTTETETTIPNEDIQKGITFRLPVDKNVTASRAIVYHYTSSLGYYNVLGDAENGKYIEVTSKEFSEFSYLLTSSDVEGTIYTANNTAGTLGSLTDLETTRATYPNAIMIVDEDYAELVQDKENVVVKYSAGKSGSYYECPKFVLTDPANITNIASDYTLADFYTPVDFTAVSGSYERSISAGNGGKTSTCCLPFALNSSIVTSGKILTYAYYEPIYDNGTKTEGAYAYFNDCTSNGIDAGTPCMLYTSSDYTLTANFNNTEIIATPDNSNNLLGTYQYKTFSGNCYGVDNAGTMLASTSGSAAFRSVLSLDYTDTFNGGSNHTETNTGNAKARFIHIRIIGDDGETTAIDGTPVESSSSKANDVIYTINGVKVTDTKKSGLYIINGKKTFVK